MGINDDLKTGMHENKKYARAKNRVKRLKGFYVHLLVYILVNCMISVIIVISTKFESNIPYREAAMRFEVYSTWIFWGIGLGFHALSVFGLPFLFGRDWEEKRIKKYLEEENKYTNSDHKWM